METDEQITVEKVFVNSPNDYATVLAIARRARQILDEYPKYEELLENEKATLIALREYMDGAFTFDAEVSKIKTDED
jgi:DNA-directed RNA polymerase omega subunit